MYMLLILVGLAVGAYLALGQGPPECDPDGPYAGDVDELIQFDGTGSSSQEASLYSTSGNSATEQRHRVLPRNMPTATRDHTRSR